MRFRQTIRLAQRDVTERPVTLTALLAMAIGGLLIGCQANSAPQEPTIEQHAQAVVENNAAIEDGTAKYEKKEKAKKKLNDLKEAPMDLSLDGEKRDKAKAEAEQAFDEFVQLELKGAAPTAEPPPPPAPSPAKWPLPRRS